MYFSCFLGPQFAKAIRQKKFEEKKVLNILKKKNINFFDLNKIKNFSANRELNDAIKTNFIIKNKIKNKISLLFLDHYNLGINWQKRVSKNIEKIIVIDDNINKKYYCDYFINFFQENIKNKNFEKKTKYIMGFENAIIQNAYFKSKVKKKRNIKRIGLFFGSSDRNSLTLKSLKKITKLKDIKLHFNIFYLTKIKTDIDRLVI